MDVITKFVVDFFYNDDEEMYENNQNFDEEAFNCAHTYHNEIEVSMSDDDFDDFVNCNVVNDIESEYGILDIRGGKDSVGFDSYEISYKDAPIVWEKLVEELKIRGHIK